ncbi:choice-of-anchor tandem repeat GloVer-containing protein [Peristeroidobacter soli]|uniref:choice-of-anchor tandem repeat GloVer-containing protein n=1 Tax=Peristeroidobacter soli TaxID=2497877 RepID=UPI00101D72FC|nr:choice-of-anchor tandem repeat GloVer-containing protein [Peristeroidobacter soli]
MKVSLSWLGVILITANLAACGGDGGRINNSGNIDNNDGGSTDNGSGGTGNVDNNDGGSADNGSGDTGDNGGNHDTPPPNFSIGGTVAGLPDGGQLSILDNGASTQTISANGPFTLSASVPTGTSYSISLDTQPPGYQCAVTQGSGTVAASNITDVTIACTQITATVGGSIDGLTATGLVLANGSDTLNVPANATTFTMPTAVASGTAYNIVVRSSPTGSRCTVNNGSGTGGDTPASNSKVSCEPATGSELYAFGGPPGASYPAGALVQGPDGNLYGASEDGGENDLGTVFMITPDGTQTVLYSFSGDSDGEHPDGGLTLGRDGNFYGTTSGGGDWWGGTAFRITPTGTKTVIWSFGGYYKTVISSYNTVNSSFGADYSDGSEPYGKLLQASDGNFYGVTSLGGDNGMGTIFRLTPSGTETVLHVFDYYTGNRGAIAGGGLIEGKDGALYGVISQQPTGPGDGTIFRMALDGRVTTLWTFEDADGIYPIGQLLQASDGNFYGVTQQGGAADQGTIYKLTPDGGFSVLYSFDRGTGQQPSAGLIEGSDGNLYGMTKTASAPGQGTLFRITPTGTYTTLYSFTETSEYSGEPYDTLFKGADGALYGISPTGGANGVGSVIQLK